MTATRLTQVNYKNYIKNQADIIAHATKNIELAVQGAFGDETYLPTSQWSRDTIQQVLEFLPECSYKDKLERDREQ